MPMSGMYQMQPAMMQPGMAPPMMQPQPAMMPQYCPASMSQPGLVQVPAMPAMFSYQGPMMMAAPYQPAYQQAAYAQQMPPQAAPTPVFQFQFTPGKGPVQPQGRK